MRTATPPRPDHPTIDGAVFRGRVSGEGRRSACRDGRAPVGDRTDCRAGLAAPSAGMRPREVMQRDAARHRAVAR